MIHPPPSCATVLLLPLSQPVLTLVLHFSYIVGRINLPELGLEPDQC